MARALTLAWVLGLGACRLGDAPAGRCASDSDCREGLVCRLDGGCAATVCADGEQVACDGGLFFAARACAGGAFGACELRSCGSANGACAPAKQLLSEPGSCGPASFAAADAGWAPVERCGDGVDNDCDGTIDQTPGACPRQAGVCAGAQRRCGDFVECSDATYSAHAGDAGRFYESFEVACDGQDNDCDGLVDVSRERSLGAGSEVKLIAENLSVAPAAFRAVLAVGRPQRIESSSFTADLRPDGTAGVAVTALITPVPRTFVEAAQNDAGTWVAWRIDGGVAAALITRGGNRLTRGSLVSGITSGPKLLASTGESDAVLVWGDSSADSGTLFLEPVRAATGFSLPQPQPNACFPASSPDFFCLALPTAYLDTASGENSVMLFGTRLIDAGIEHDLTLVSTPPLGSDAGCASGFVGVGPLCVLLPYPTLSGYGVLAERRARQAWGAVDKLDVRVLLGPVEDPQITHTFAGNSGWPTTDAIEASPDEGSLTFGRERDGGLSRGWFVQRSGNLILALPERTGDAGSALVLSDAGVSQPTAAWSPRDSAHVAVAYVVSGVDGGSEVMGRSLCVPR